MKLAVEDGSIRHLDMLYKIEQECFEKEAFSKSQIAQLLTDYNSVSLVASVRGEIVGFIAGSVCIDRKMLNAHILTIDVVPTLRRKGVGKRLLSEIEKTFMEVGVKVCHLEVRENNIAAISLYRKSGYREIGRIRGYYGSSDGIYLRKLLYRRVRCATPKEAE